MCECECECVCVCVSVCLCVCVCVCVFVREIERLGVEYKFFSDCDYANSSDDAISIYSRIAEANQVGS